MTGSISMRHSDRAANDIHEGGIVQSAPLSLQHTAVHNNYNIQIFKNAFHQYCTRQYLNNYDIPTRDPNRALSQFFFLSSSKFWKHEKMKFQGSQLWPKFCQFETLLIEKRLNSGFSHISCYFFTFIFTFTFSLSVFSHISCHF